MKRMSVLNEQHGYWLGPVIAFLMLLALLALFPHLPSARGSGYSPGYVNSDGYTYQRYAGNGQYYWYYRGYGYYSYTPGRAGYYSSCGCYYYQPVRPYYTLQYADDYQAPVSYKDPDWRIKLLAIAEQRDKAELEIRKGAFEQAYFNEAVRVLGLEGNFRITGYGARQPYYPGSSYSPAAESYQVQATSNTLYGKSFSSIAEVYGDTNLSVLYQQAHGLAEQAQRLAGQGAADFSALVGQEGSNRAKVAEVLARGQATAEAFRALQDSGSRVTTKTYSFRVGPQGVEKVEPPPQFNNGPQKGVQPKMPRIPEDNGNGNGPSKEEAKVLFEGWKQSALKHGCVDCHAGNGKYVKNFDVTQFWLLPKTSTDKDALTRDYVVARLRSQDPDLLMPRQKKSDGSAGGPGSPIPEAEIRQYWEAPLRAN